MNFLNTVQVKFFETSLRTVVENKIEKMCEFIKNKKLPKTRRIKSAIYKNQKFLIPI